MLSRRARALLLASGVLAAIVPAAMASQPGGELPPGFGDPGTPKATPPPPPTLPPPTVTPTPPPAVTPTPTRPIEQPVQETTDSALEDLQMLPPPPPPPFYDVPRGQERPVEAVGVLNVTNRGLPLDAFGATSGPFVTTLMQRLDAPVPSRWTQILLRRSLMSRVSAPAMVNPVDFVAERARLLVRMGEADAARMLVQAVDLNNYTPSMVSAAFEASLAGADPAGLCPLIQRGREIFDDPAWPLADAMCASMEGESARASTLLDEGRGKGATGVDLLLAEKIVGAGTNTRRSVEIDWGTVPDINLWRFGLASASGAVVPERLLVDAGPRMAAFMARAPMVPVEARLAAADTAAVLGVFSSASLVDAHSLVFELRQAGDASEDRASQSVTSRLSSAFTGDMSARIAAMRQLWQDGAEDSVRRYARLILTAGAASQVPADGDYRSDADEVVASLLAAGMDGQAAAWADGVESEGDSSLAWALLAVGAPRPLVSVSDGRIGGFSDGPNGDLKVRMLAAALAGLGRADDGIARGRGVDLAREDEWTRALDTAASAGQGGTVALLAAIGMQAPDWRGVPPEHLYRIVRALRQTGLEFEARMIAAEALTRL